MLLKLKLNNQKDGIEIGSTQIHFMRTLRIPDDGRQHALPPGLGRFSVRRVEDYADRVPKAWLKHGGVFIPMHEREALWLNFTCPGSTPMALKVGVGMVNAVTGKPWSETLCSDEQDYMVVPNQPWLDGIKTEGDSIRQFVAMALGKGYTVEGQVTGQEKHGGLQILAFEAKKGAIKPPVRRRRSMDVRHSMDDFGGQQDMCFDSMVEPQACMGIGAAMPASAPALRSRRAAKKPDLGLAAGGRMSQKIYDDPHGAHVWDLNSKTRVFVHFCNAEQWQQITGEQAPALPQEVENYQGPWFDIQDEHVSAVPGSQILDNVKTVDEIDKQKAKTVIYPYSDPNVISDGDW